jgi:GT2 family glycosyltransferase
MERERQGDFVVYDTAYEDLTLSLDDLPSDLPFGLYKLSIAIGGGLKANVSAEIKVEREGTEERVRVVVEPFETRVDLYFVLLGHEQRPVLTIALDGPSRIALGGAELQRVSTTRWRGRRLNRWLQRRIRKPSLLVQDVRDLVEDTWAGGVHEIRRRTTEAISPSIWSEKRRLDHRLSRTLRQISMTNRDLLATWRLRQTRPPASLSLVVPIYRTPLPWLDQLIASLRHQTDTNFEVVFVLDGPQPDLERELVLRLDETFAHRVLVLPENRGVSAATNAGMRLASGDYVLVVDHDDILERHLVEAFHCVSAMEESDLYVADEVIADDAMETVRLVASRGRFDIRYYLSHPYVVHPIFVRRSLAEEVGLLDEALRISHDVDFMLRCLARARNVTQIPLLLYVWRTHTGSLGHAAADGVFANTSAAVRTYLSTRTNWPTFEVRKGINFNELDVRPPLPKDARVAIVVPTKNGLSVLRQCLTSIYERASSNTTPADIVVVDHQSDDPATLRYLSEESAAGRIRLVPYVGPWNYSAINNAAIARKVSGRGYSHIVLMNNDIELMTQDWLDRMIAQFSWGDVGVVGCCLLYPDGRVQHGGVVVGLVGAADHSHRFEDFLQAGNGPRSPGYLSSLVATRDYSAVTAALMMVSLPLFEAVGGLDERLAIGFNDTDLCLRIGERGFHSTYVGGVVAIHHESVTRKSHDGVDHPADTALFECRYADMMRDGDPYYGASLEWTQTRIVQADQVQKSFMPRVSSLGDKPVI